MLTVSVAVLRFDHRWIVWDRRNRTWKLWGEILSQIGPAVSPDLTRLAVLKEEIPPIVTRSLDDIKWCIPVFGLQFAAALMMESQQHLIAHANRDFRVARGADILFGVQVSHPNSGTLPDVVQAIDVLLDKI